MPINTFVTVELPLSPAAARSPAVAFLTPVGRPAHSGHLIPTGPKTMHSGQIGRSQSEHVTAVSVRGWR
jgi:hypothetical protein